MYIVSGLDKGKCLVYEAVRAGLRKYTDLKSDVD